MLFFKRLYWNLWFRFRSDLSTPHPSEVREIIKRIDTLEKANEIHEGFYGQCRGYMRDVAIRYASIYKYKRPYDILVNCSGHTVTGTAERARQIICKFRREYRHLLKERL